MKNAIVFVSLTVFSFGTGWIVSADNSNNPPDRVVVEVPQQNEVQMVDGLQLVFVTEDGKMIFKRTSVPAYSMNMNDFTHYMQTRQRPSPIDIAGVD